MPLSTSLAPTVVLFLAASVPVVAAYRSASIPAPAAVAPSTTWRSVVQSDEGFRLQNVTMRHDGIGLAVTGGHLWRTTDGGHSWGGAKAPRGAIGVALRDDGVGLIVS